MKGIHIMNRLGFLGAGNMGSAIMKGVSGKSALCFAYDKDGEKLKHIGTLARKDIEDLLGVKVNLQIFVKVKENWRENERFILENNIADE